MHVSGEITYTREETEALTRKLMAEPMPLTYEQALEYEALPVEERQAIYQQYQTLIPKKRGSSNGRW